MKQNKTNQLNKQIKQQKKEKKKKPEEDINLWEGNLCLLMGKIPLFS